jgi:DNA-binding winged helix-turn-helix (wHTH) protein
MEPDLQSPGSDLFVWRIGPVVYDEGARELRVDDVPATLEPKPMQLLSALLRHVGEVVTKAELFDTVWTGQVTVDHVLATAIGKLRQVLRAAPDVQIVTVPRVGYRLDATVQRVVARKLSGGQLQLKPGQAVPLRPNFRLQRALAQTDNSEVWLAYNRRAGEYRVYKFATDARRLTSLKREATLARVLRESLGERPDFIRILDWNLVDLPFFLECEYGGVSLREWAGDSAGLAPLSRSGRIDLVLRIVDAVAAAHSVGVLHKDIKPDNVLIQADDNGGPPSVRLTDFGSGGLLDPRKLAALGITRMGFTQTRDLAQDTVSGTLLYLAPELFSGTLPTAQSDVYALGVLLYQCLIGDFRKPLSSGWERDIDDTVLTGDIAAATDGDPQRRIASAAELAQRLRQLPQRRKQWEKARTDERALASTRAALDRARARRPWMIVALITLLVGMGSSLWMYRQAERERVQAERFLASASAVQSFLANDVVAQFSPADRRFDASNDPAEVIERAGAAVDARFSDDPFAAGSLHVAIGSALRSFDRFGDSSARHFRRAIDIGVEHFGADNELTLKARHGLVQSLIYANHYDQARAELRVADDAAGNLLLKRNRIALGSSLAHANLRLHSFDFDGMLEALLRARELHRAVQPDNIETGHFIEQGIADAQLRTGEPHSALNTIEDFLRDVPLERLDPGRQAIFLSLKSRALRTLDQLGPALDHAIQAYDIYERQIGPHAHSTIVTLSAISNLHYLLGHCEQALDTARDAFHRMTQLQGEHSQAALIELGNLGLRQCGCGRLDEGIASVSQAIGQLEQVYGQGNGAARQFKYFLTGYLIEAAQYPQALDLLDELSAQVAAAPPSAHLTLHHLNARRADILSRMGDIGAARAIWIALIDELEASQEQAELLGQARDRLTTYPES